MDAEVARMMTDGKFHWEAVDEVTSEYEDYKDCLGEPGGNFLTCPTGPGLEAVGSLVGVINASAAAVQANLVEPLPEQEMVDPNETNPEVIDIAARSLALRIDRSQGLFHPNAAGHAVQACRVLAVYKGENQCGSVCGCEVLTRHL